MSLRIGTRGSALALAQAHWVASRLGGEVVVLRTSGDAGATGDKSRWVDTIEAALVSGEIDLAVHSAKDVPGELAAGTEIVACPPREDPRDVLIGGGRRIGTSSLRRRAQLLAHDPSLEVVDLRGNVDTRLRKLASGEVDALVLAAAGLRRLGREEAGEALDDAVFVPAPGQGVLALQAREGDGRASALNDEAAFLELACERALVVRLGATCHTPVGAHAVSRSLGFLGRPGMRSLAVRAFAGRPDGSAWVVDEQSAIHLATEGVAAARQLGVAVAERMLAAGAAEVLA